MGSSSRPSTASVLYLQGAPASAVVEAFVADWVTTLQSSRYPTQPTKCCRVATTFDAQRTFVEVVLRHPVAVQFPLRAGYAGAVGKRYVQRCEDDWLVVTQSTTLLPDDDGDDDSAVCEELYEWYAEVVGQQQCSDGQQVAGNNPLSFRSYFLGPAVKEASQGRCLDAADGWVHVHVGAQFTNVGLSLWPSAFILLEVLREALAYPQTPHPTSWENKQEDDNAAVLLQGGCLLHRGQQAVFENNNKPETAEPIALPPPTFRFLELGSGVGLTGVILEQLAALCCIDASRVASCTLTDYQECILDNARSNMAAVRGGLKCNTTCALLDWTNDTQTQEAVFENWCREESPLTRGRSTGVIIAADCIYDIDVVDGLTNTLRLGLEALKKHHVIGQSSVNNADIAACSDNHGGPSVDLIDESCAIVVQTHRQEQTMKYFFDRVHTFANVQSWAVELPNAPVSPTCDTRLQGRPSSGAAPSGLFSDIRLEHFRLRRLADPLSIHHPQVPSAVGGDVVVPSCLVGPFWVDMPSLICVHRLALK